MSNDIWLNMFDDGERRSAERQLCLLRDRLVKICDAWDDVQNAQRSKDKVAAKKIGSTWQDVPLAELEITLDDQIRPAYLLCLEAELLLSGILIGREQGKPSGS